MKKNRKNADTYRFNGNPSLHAHSIQSVTIPDLESRIEEFEAKLSDPDDPDDKKWTARWLKRFESELAKKRKGLALKEREGPASARTRERGPFGIDSETLCEAVLGIIVTESGRARGGLAASGTNVTRG
jgi:hypothetical protein